MRNYMHIKIEQCRVASEPLELEETSAWRLRLEIDSNQPTQATRCVTSENRDTGGRENQRLKVVYGTRVPEYQLNQCPPGFRFQRPTDPTPGDPRGEAGKCRTECWACGPAGLSYVTIARAS